MDTRDRMVAPIVELVEFDADSIRFVEAELLRVCDRVRARLGVRFKVQSATQLADGTLAFTIHATQAIVDGEERESFVRLAHMYGLEPWMLDRSFTHAGRRYRVCGLRPRCGHRPVTCQEIATGRRAAFRTTVGRILRELRNAEEGQENV